MEKFMKLVDAIVDALEDGKLSFREILTIIKVISKLHEKGEEKDSIKKLVSPKK
jgi:hypothetical protein